MSITINGQLLLTMLAEKLVDNIEGLTMLQVNTDGLTVKFDNKHRKQVDDICNIWEKDTGLELEYGEYKQMIIRNVNNYIAEYTNGKVKLKGEFEIEKDWHKDHSMLIVPKALKAYFIDGISPEETVNNGDIWDFMKVFNATKGWQTELHTINGVEKHQKTTRYIISNLGGGLYKHHEDGRMIAIESGYNSTIINDFNENVDYYSQLNKRYYIKEIYKVISELEDNQLTMF